MATEKEPNVFVGTDPSLDRRSKLFQSHELVLTPRDWSGYLNYDPDCSRTLTRGKLLTIVSFSVNITDMNTKD